MAYFTEKELLERFEFYTMQLEERLLEGESFESLAEEVPFVIQLNDPKTFKTLHANSRIVDYSGFEFEEIQEKWEEYLEIVHPETVESMIKFLPSFYSTQSTRQTLSFVQHVKVKKSKDYSPFISFTKPSVLPGGLIIWLTASPDELGKYSKPISQIVKMDQFKLRHFKRFQQLTNREVEVLRLLANGYNNPRIAKKLFLSRQTVETHRKNLKRKLELRSFRKLMKYAFAFNLVEV